MSADLWDHFGLRADPFQAGTFVETRDSKGMAERMRRAVANRDWVLFYGPPGAGKTWTKDEIAADLAETHYVVEVLSCKRRWVYLNNVCDALCIDLDIEDALGERPRLARETRMRQVRRLMGVRSRQKEIVLLLDEATMFNDNFLDEVKWLRDLRFGPDKFDQRKPDRRPLCTVAMFGWRQLADRIARNPQHRIRVRRHELTGLSQAEVSRFIEELGLARAVPEAARAALWQAGRFPGEIRNLVTEGMERALVQGRRHLLPEDVLPEAQALAEQLKTGGVLFSEVAKIADVSNSTVSNYFAGKITLTSKTGRDVVLAARRLLAEKETATRNAERGMRSVG